MKYKRPEVTFSVAAPHAVRGFGKIPYSNSDVSTQNLPPSMYRFTVPAYEADE
jgi:hypothetical protein